MKKGLVLTFLVGFCLTAGASAWVFAPGEDPCRAAGNVSDASAEAAASARPLIVIDAGHGGMDGGASAKDGTQEKDINLAIAKYLAEEIRMLF